MTHSKHGRRQRTPVQEALLHVPSDLDEIRRRWPLAVQQLQPTSSTPPAMRLVDLSEEARAARDTIARAERDERVENARRGRPTLGFSPAPLRVAVLDDLAAATGQLMEVADKVTDHVRRGRDEQERPGPHRSMRHPFRPTIKHNDRDHLGYPLRLGYGKHTLGGRQLNLVGARRDIDPILDAIAWLHRALSAITDIELAENVARTVARCRLTVRGVAGLPDLQVRLTPHCFVCDQPSLRMNLDKRFVECRNGDCQPTEEQCGFTGPRGEPRWYQGEWAWLSQILGVSLGDQLLQLLEQVAS